MLYLIGLIFLVAFGTVAYLWLATLSHTAHVVCSGLCGLLAAIVAMALLVLTAGDPSDHP